MRSLTSPITIILTLFTTLVLPACAMSPEKNPSFSITTAEAKADLRAMRDEPKPLARPLIIIAGWNSPGITIAWMADRLRSLTTNPDSIITISVFSNRTFDTAARRVISKLEARFPSSDPTSTIEVDVIGLSMGGLVARYAALPEAPGGKQLRINRLFTLATPHHGAKMASRFTLDPRVKDMCASSPFLCALDSAATTATYAVIPYVTLGDGMVGSANARWIDGHVWWVPARPLAFPHLSITGDPRLIADMARRLRGETPYTTLPAAPLPG